MNFQSDFQQPFALVFDFSALLVDNLNWNSCMHVQDGVMRNVLFEMKCNIFYTKNDAENL
jgi:hypothetical protein